MQFWRRDDIIIATINANSWNGDLFDLKEKNFLRKIWFTVKIIHRKPRKILKTCKKKQKNRSMWIHAFTVRAKIEEKKIFRRKIQFLEWMIFLVTLISPNSTCLSENLLVLQQEMPCIHRFNMVIFYKFTNFGVTSGTCTNKFGFLAISTSWHMRKKVKVNTSYLFNVQIHSM